MECAICFNEFDMNIHKPLILNCGHSFCSNCMSLLFQTKKGSDRKKKKKGENSGSVICPTCNVAHRCRNAESIAQNYSLVQSIELIKQEKLRKQKESEKHEPRLQQQVEQQRQQEQLIIQPETDQQRDEDVPLPSYGVAICPVHGEHHTWYDTQCEQLMCNQCRKSDHKGHECCPLSDYVELSYRFALLGQRDEFDFLEALSVIPDNYVCLGFLAVLLYHSEIYAVIPRDIPRAKLLAQGFIDGLKREGINPTDLTHTERLNLHEQFILGEIYFEGMVYPRNSQLAWALMTISAKAGHCDAMAWLGSHVFSNSKESYLQSRRTSFDWLMLAAEEFNHPQAQCLLGYYFETGNVEGVPRDLTESIKRYKSAADDGFAEAQCRLANLYYNESRHTEAIPYWTRSCEQGYTSAIFTFAEQLIFFPYAHDPVKAVELYKRNISFGDLDVTCVYASILEHGHCGFPQDLQEASRLKAITKQHKYKPTPLVLDVLRSIREKSKKLMRKRMMMANHELVKLGAEVF